MTSGRSPVRAQAHALALVMGGRRWERPVDQDKITRSARC